MNQDTKLLCAMDLHSNNAYTGIINLNGKRLFDKRLPNDLNIILPALAPFQQQIQRIAVESTYNWYWLADGLQDAGYEVVLANPSAMQQYKGLKHADDRSDTFWIAEMMRLDILPTGHIYDKAKRPLRDLLRRRLWMVQQRTRHILSLISLFTRHSGKSISAASCYTLGEDDFSRCFSHEHTRLEARMLQSNIITFRQHIRDIEKVIRAHFKIDPRFEILRSTPGIGLTLAATIGLEAGEMSRFKSAGNYASYCRTVKSNWSSNHKQKGKGNVKNGNKYLSWAYVEAANFAARFDPQIGKYMQRKTARKNRCVATKSIAAKLAKANFYMLKEQKEYNGTLAFGS